MRCIAPHSCSEEGCAGRQGDGEGGGGAAGAEGQAQASPEWFSSSQSTAVLALQWWCKSIDGAAAGDFPSHGGPML